MTRIISYIGGGGVRNGDNKHSLKTISFIFVSKNKARFSALTKVTRGIISYSEKPYQKQEMKVQELTGNAVDFHIASHSPYTHYVLKAMVLLWLQLSCLILLQNAVKRWV